MKKASAILLLALLVVFATAQINNPSSPGTTINPTNNAIPKRSNGTTFVDSSCSDDGTSVTCTDGSLILGSTFGQLCNGSICMTILNGTTLMRLDNVSEVAGSADNVVALGDATHRFTNAFLSGQIASATASVNATAPAASSTLGIGYDSTTKTANYNANAGTTSSFSGAWNIVNVTPVTLPGTSTTADQNLITVTIPAGTLNKALRGLRIYAAGVYSTAATSTAQITLKAKLCTVSGCGSGTVLSVCSIQTIALASVTVSGNTWVLDCLPITQTAGASGAFERSGRLSIDLGSLTTAADSIFLDPAATATLGTIDTTAQLFLQVSIAFSAASTSNVATQRQLVAETVN